MIECLAALIVYESKWLTVSIGLAIVVASTLLYRLRTVDVSDRRQVEATMNLFFGVTLPTIALGYLLAVTIKLLTGPSKDQSRCVAGLSRRSVVLGDRDRRGKKQAKVGPRGTSLPMKIRRSGCPPVGSGCQILWST